MTEYVDSFQKGSKIRLFLMPVHEIFREDDVFTIITICITIKIMPPSHPYIIKNK